MSSVLVLGATGYVGNAVAKEFQNKGYKVYGLTRTEEKAKLLRKQEIVPLLGKAQDTSVWESTAKRVDIVVEALADFQDHSTAGVVQKALLSILSSHPNKVVIYTSGVWLYGNTTQHVDESFELTQAPDLVKPRIEIEKQWRASGAIVLRPANVYGHSSSLTGNIFFKNVKEGKGEFAGNPNNEPHWSYVHVDDVADGYVRTAERAASLRGQVIDLVSHTEAIRPILENLAKITGYKGDFKFIEPKDPFSVCVGLSQKHLKGTKARLVLDWNPKQSTIVSDTEKYFKAWEAQL